MCVFVQREQRLRVKDSTLGGAVMSFRNREAGSPLAHARKWLMAEGAPSVSGRVGGGECLGVVWSSRDSGVTYSLMVPTEAERRGSAV